MVNIEKTNPNFPSNEMDERFKLIKGISQDEETDHHLRSDLYFIRVMKARDQYNSELEDESKKMTIDQAFSLASAFYGEPQGFDLTLHLSNGDDFGSGD